MLGDHLGTVGETNFGLVIISDEGVTKLCTMAFKHGIWPQRCDLHIRRRVGGIEYAGWR
jgi:hypothetical protein